MKIYEHVIKNAHMRHGSKGERDLYRKAIKAARGSRKARRLATAQAA